MYMNLKAEIVRKGLKTKDIAKKVSLSEKTINNKISGRTAFTIPEAIKIRDIFFPNIPIDELFKI